MKKVIVFSLVFIIILLIIIVFYPNKMAVLGYHDFTTGDSTNEFMMNNKEFERQIKYLYDHHYKSLKLKDIECYLKKECKIPKKSILITMDDGYKSNLDIAIPILEKYHMNGVIFYIGVNYYDDNNLYLNKDDIDNILNNHKNIEIASHTYNMHYPEAYLLSKEEIKKDIKLQKEIIDTKYFAYPYGLYNNNYIKTLKEEDYKLAFTFGPDKNHRKVKQSDNNYEIPRLNMGANYPFWKFKLRMLLPF